MALVFPLSLAAFADLLRIQSGAFSTPDNHQVTGLGSGHMLTAEFFDAVWQVQMQTAPMLNTDARRVAAIARALVQEGGSFRLYDHLACYPKLDPGGHVLGAEIVTVTGIQPSALRLGMPALYQVSAGDRFSISDGGRVYYGEFSEGGPSGVYLDVFPSIPAWVNPGMLVTLKKPAALMKIRPGSLQMTPNGPRHSTISFEAFEAVR